MARGDRRVAHPLFKCLWQDYDYQSGPVFLNRCAVTHKCPFKFSKCAAKSLHRCRWKCAKEPNFHHFDLFLYLRVPRRQFLYEKDNAASSKSWETLVWMIRSWTNFPIIYITWPSLHELAFFGLSFKWRHRFVELFKCQNSDVINRSKFYQTLISLFLQCSFLSLAILKCRQYFRMIQILKLNYKKTEKNLHFMKKKVW